MPRTATGWQITPEELRDWTLDQDAGLLVLNKPAHVVCHPSKFGPWSSLAGACREYLGVERVHLPLRLDRETSGVVLVAKNHETGLRLHAAVKEGAFEKRYLAILHGELRELRTVDAPIARDPDSPYTTLQTITPAGRPAVTRFEPIASGSGFTFASVVPATGRMHQIRVHASSIGHPLVGDKLYGPGPQLMLEFIRTGFTPELAKLLLLDRQALHAAQLSIDGRTFRAPLTIDLEDFLRARGIPYG